MRIRAAIIDTDVVVAGILTADSTSPTARVVDGMLAARFSFLLSVELLSEYRRVLLRPAIQQFHRLDIPHIDQILTEFIANGAVREPGPSADAPDSGDQHLWDLLAGQAGSALVTGDRRLLLQPPEGTSVISPAAFVQLLND